MASTKKRKTWREKLTDRSDLPKVCPIEGKMSKRWGEGTVVIPSPSEVDAIMRQVRPGKLITIDEILRHAGEEARGDHRLSHNDRDLRMDRCPRG